MATDVPGVLIVSNWQGHGPRNPVINPEYPTQALDAMHDLRLTEFVPGGATEPASPDFFPWFDGSASPTLYTAATSGHAINAIKASVNPGWAINEHAGKQLTVLQPFLGVQGLGLPYVKREYQIIQSNTADTLTTAANMSIVPNGTLVPQPDIFRIGTGRFIVYNAVPNVVGSAGGVGEGLGSSWLIGGPGCGLDALLVRELYQRVWTTSPYFHVWKLLTGDGLYSGWRPGSNTRLNFPGRLAEVVAAAAERGNTIKWKLVLIDLSQEDIRGWTTSIESYTANLIELIEYFRTTLGNPELHFQIVNHHPQFLAINNPGIALLFRQIHDTVARTVPRTRTIDMSGARLARETQMVGPLASDALPDRQFYSAFDTFDSGRRVVDTYLKQLSNLPSVPKAGRALVYHIGDSICTGGISAAMISQLESQILIGAPPLTVRTGNLRVYNRIAAQLQQYDPTQNSNTSGTVNNAAGPDMTITAAMEVIWPEGSLFGKRGSNGSSLAANTNPYTAPNGVSGGRWSKAYNEHWYEWLADIAAIQALAFAAGFDPDARAVCVSLGSNDSVLPGGGTLFAEALPQFVEDIQAVVPTRSGNSKVHILWRPPQPSFRGGRSEEIAIIRAALTQRASADPYFHVVSCDDLETNRSDRIHETPESQLIHGRRFGERLQSLALTS